MPEIKGQAVTATLLLEKQAGRGLGKEKHIQAFGLSDEKFRWK